MNFYQRRKQQQKNITILSSVDFQVNTPNQTKHLNKMLIKLTNLCFYEKKDATQLPFFIRI